MTVIRRTQFFNVDVHVRRIESGTVVVTSYDENDEAAVFMTPEEFLDFAAEVARIAEAIEAERATEEAPVRRTCFGPQEMKP